MLSFVKPYDNGKNGKLSHKWQGMFVKFLLEVLMKCFKLAGLWFILAIGWRAEVRVVIQ
jgi:hypothetical protein